MFPPIIHTRRLELVPFTPEVLSLLLAGRVQDAERAAGFDVPPAWPEEAAPYLRLRYEQIRARPEDRAWLDRGIVLPGRRRELIGHTGFHGGPDARGVPEFGYQVFEPHRGRGVATEAVLGLLGWAARDMGVARFRASVAPDNTPSLAILHRLGFEHVGEQMDDKDGLELIFEGEWANVAGAKAPGANETAG